MVRAFVLLLAALSFLLPFCASATGQAAERLIVGRDTMCLFALPLATADSTVLARLGARLKEIDAPWSTACWRAYIGVWRLDKEMLWLERVETTEGDPVFTGAELFPKSTERTRVRADWFNGEIRYGKGDLVYYQHDGFMQNLEQEWVATVSEGRVKGTKTYRNRLYKKGVGLEDNAGRVAAAFDRLYVGELPDMLTLHVVFAADSTGRVARIDQARLLMPEKETVGDSADPRLQAAVRAFRSATRWDAYWIKGAWKERQCFIPLRRGWGSLETPAETTVIIPASRRAA